MKFKNYFSLLLSGTGSFATQQQQHTSNILFSGHRYVKRKLDPIKLLSANTTSAFSHQNSTDTTNIDFKEQTPRALSSDEWDQMGEDILGETYLDLSGKGLSISDNGSIVAIGAVDNDGTSNVISDDQGHTRVYEYNGISWNKLGSDIDGEYPEDNYGFDVSLSGDGTTLAVSAPGHDRTTTPENIGRVQIFRFIGTDWVQIGSDIFGESAGDLNGFSVSLSYNGNSIAIGAPQSDISTKPGYARVYKFETSSSDWIQQGTTIMGEGNSDKCGSSVSLSSDGNFVAVGAPSNNPADEINANSQSGHVRVHRFIGNDWSQLGQDIDGEGYYSDEFGSSVSLSSEGTVVAIGAPVSNEKGEVSVYAFDTSDTLWKKRGDDLVGTTYEDLFGHDVSISNDGNRLAIGSPGYGLDVGRLDTYEWDDLNSTWASLKLPIIGDSIGDQFGTTVAMSGNGRRVAVGAIYHGKDTVEGSFPRYSGQVKVYEDSGKQYWMYQISFNHFFTTE